MGVGQIVKALDAVSLAEPCFAGLGLRDLGFHVVDGERGCCRSGFAGCVSVIVVLRCNSEERDGDIPLAVGNGGAPRLYGVALWACVRW